MQIYGCLMQGLCDTNKPAQKERPEPREDICADPQGQQRHRALRRQLGLLRVAADSSRAAI